MRCAYSGHSTRRSLNLVTFRPDSNIRQYTMACHERAQRVEWSDGESNPDLLNAIQPSSR